MQEDSVYKRRSLLRVEPAWGKGGGDCEPGGVGPVCGDVLTRRTFKTQ